jgi:hypothetical protein
MTDDDYEEKIYTGDLVEKYDGELDNGEIGIVLAIAVAVRGEKIYKVIVNDELKNWYGNYVRKVQKNAA